MSSANGGTITLRLKLDGAQELKDALNTLGPVGKNALKQIEDATKELNTGTQFTRMQMMELAHVGRSAFDALAAGANPLRVIAMEGGRATQALSASPGGLAGGFSTLIKFMNPAVIAGLAFATAVGGIVLVEQQYEAQHRQLINVLLGSGRATGITIDQLEKIAEATSKAGGGSITFAEDAERAFIGIRGMTEQNLGVAVGLLKDFSARTGQDAKEATKDLATALEDPITGFQRLNRELGFLTPVQVEQIKHFQDLGDYAHAAAIGLAALKTNVTGAHDELTGLGKILETVANKFSQATTEAGKFFSHIVHERTLDELEAKLKSLQTDGVQGKAHDQQIAAVQAAITVAKKAQGITASAQATSAEDKSDQYAQDIIDKSGTNAQRKSIKGIISTLQAKLDDKNNTLNKDDIRNSIQDLNNQLKSLDKKDVGPKAPAIPDYKDTRDSVAATADKILADAKLALAASIEDRAKAERDQINANADKEEATVRKSLNADKSKEANAVREKALAEIESARQLKLQAVNEKERSALAQARLQVDQDALQTYRQSMQYQLSMAATQAQRLAIALATLEAEKKVELEVADEALRKAKASGTQRDIDAATAHIDQINQRYAIAGKAAAQQYQGPGAAYLTQLNQANAAIGEGVENIAVNSLKSLNDGLAGAITGTQKLGDVFKNVTAGIIADLAKIAVQKMITAPLANALFGGSSGGVSTDFITSLFTPHADGGLAQGFSMVGEKGTELVDFKTPGRVYTNDALRSMVSGGSTAPAGGVSRSSAPNVSLGDTHYHIHAPGADPAQLRRVELQLMEMQRREPERFVAYYRAVQKATR